MTFASPEAAAAQGGRECPRCGAELGLRLVKCSRCGHRAPEAVEAIRQEGSRRSRSLAKRKKTADLFFLAGLLLGGPLLSFDIRAGTGLFLILGGGVASVLRRYTSWSTAGTLVVGALSAAVVAVAVSDPGAGADQGEGAGPDPAAREAFVARLGERWLDRGVHVESRGATGTVIWFRIPTAEQEECGSFPPAEVREHLRGLGVRRVVVAARRGDRGFCTFAP